MNVDGTCSIVALFVKIDPIIFLSVGLVSRKSS
jgi:hypothetical protein